MDDHDGQLIDRYYSLLHEYNMMEYQEPRNPRRAHEHERRIVKTREALNELAAQLGRNWQDDRRNEAFMRDF